MNSIKAFDFMQLIEFKTLQNHEIQALVVQLFLPVNHKQMVYARHQMLIANVLHFCSGNIHSGTVMIPP